MTNNKRYERQDTGVVLNKTGQTATGIPVSENVPAGAPQFDAYIEAERKASDAARSLSETTGKMEDRDQRGADAIDGAGKTKARIPIHEVDALAEEMAGRFSNSVDRVRSELQGDVLTVTITTKHGTSTASADVDDWSAAGVKKALKTIEEKMQGKSNTDKESSEPKDKLADAIRDIAKG